jgi:hypothetical protein
LIHSVVDSSHSSASSPRKTNPADPQHLYHVSTAVVSTSEKSNALSKMASTKPEDSAPAVENVEEVESPEQTKERAMRQSKSSHYAASVWRKYREKRETD